MSIYDTAVLRDSLSDTVSLMTLHMMREHPDKNIYKAIIDEVDKAVISTSLARTEGNQTKASKAIGVNRGTFKDKRVALNIDKRGVCK